MNERMKERKKGQNTQGIKHFPPSITCHDVEDQHTIVESLDEIIELGMFVIFGGSWAFWLLAIDSCSGGI